MGQDELPHDELGRESEKTPNQEKAEPKGEEENHPSELTYAGPIQSIVSQFPADMFSPRARLALVGAFGSMFCTVGFLNAFGVFETYYKEYQLADKSEFTISWIGAINFFCIFSGSILTGPLMDISGPQVSTGPTFPLRRRKWICLIGILKFHISYSIFITDR